MLFQSHQIPNHPRPVSFSAIAAEQRLVVPSQQLPDGSPTMRLFGTPKEVGLGRSFVWLTRNLWWSSNIFTPKCLTGWKTIRACSNLAKNSTYHRFSKWDFHKTARGPFKSQHKYINRKEPKKQLCLWMALVFQGVSLRKKYGHHLLLKLWLDLWDSPIPGDPKTWTKGTGQQTGWFSCTASIYVVWGLLNG